MVLAPHAGPRYTPAMPIGWTPNHPAPSSEDARSRALYRLVHTPGLNDYAVELLSADPDSVDWAWLESAPAVAVAAWWADARRS